MAGERLTPPLLRKQLPRRLQCQARAVLSEVHADRTGFRSYLAGAGRIEHDTIRHSAESAGVFGVPSFIVEGELFWGREHLADIREKLPSLARNNPARVAPSC
jgi:hypothetical protein